ncbi:FAD-dependent oxidoreductase [Mucilaginibacter myungsuensis]|uniref:Flavin-dependent monooxygenase n=1 Tax=Mucilaginibacter myungsuensis TaxID=649104 RepID=A0A929L2X8_9SPHI|nr:NAD(P)/FAD-dependent oxidoreductase [Mucilaginibacter myungsuensis]MBE9664673.1 FAD-dependent monooxygenase [Mucilaginibacter myungsuensis]MDN3601122.1 NAD(P)/FAD-dependent oxidoreductase [Mucilaginibacter myungsuensis]
MLLKDKQVAIVGGGPGGLTLAKLLQLKGVDVTLYERDADQNARVQGSPLDLHEHSGMAALREAGLLEAFKQNFLPGADRKLITDAQAQVYFSDHDKPEENFGHQHFRPEIDRGTLRKILLDSLKPRTVVWDSHFTGMDKQGEGWSLHFKYKASVYADLVIAADGANSKIRPYITDIKPFYSGITMLEGNVRNAVESAPQVSKLIKGGKIMAFGKGKDLLLGQKGNGDLGFYASIKVPEDWSVTNGLNYKDNEQVLTWFKEFYNDWSSIWYELFQNAETPFIPRPINCMPLDQTWQALPNATMIGDAAHVMPPFAGEGANMAMLDALELSRALTDDTCKHLQEAIAAFEEQMRARAAVAARESLANGELMHADNALADMLAMFGGH